MTHDPIVSPDALLKLRELACRQTGMTIDQLLEAEKNVCHPKEVIPVKVTPTMLASARMKKAGVPARHIENVCQTLPFDVQALRAIRQWSDTRDAFLALQGGVGTFKTGSASWVLGQLDDGVFLESAVVIKTVLENKPRWEQILDAPLVVLDDLGQERRDSQGVWIDAFTELWNATYNGNKRLILTTNTVDPDAFKREVSEGGYGPRAYSRLRESGRWVLIEGGDMRGREPGEDDDR